MREASRKLSLGAGSLDAGLMVGELGIRYLGSYERTATLLFLKGG